MEGSGQCGRAPHWFLARHNTIRWTQQHHLSARFTAHSHCSVGTSTLSFLFTSRSITHLLKMGLQPYLGVRSITSAIKYWRRLRTVLGSSHISILYILCVTEIPLPLSGNNIFKWILSKMVGCFYSQLGKIHEMIQFPSLVRMWEDFHHRSRYERTDLWHVQKRWAWDCLGILGHLLELSVAWTVRC